MANNKFYVKRTSTSGRTPNTSNPSNTSFIGAGEFALNMSDGILYSSNGSSLIEIGSNNTNINVTGIAVIKDVELSSNNNSASAANTQTVISTFPVNKYRGGKFIILGRRSTDSQISEFLFTHNTSNVSYTEYNIVYTNTSLFSVSANIVSGNVDIIATSPLADISYDVYETKFVNTIDDNVYDRYQEMVYDRFEELIETRAA